jgi:hypothetical protein
MKPPLLFALVITDLIFSACRNNSITVSEKDQNVIQSIQIMESEMTDISFVQAKNYFVRIGAQIPNNPKIETAEQFNEIFGMGTTMGPGGKPTDIDFSTNYVIAVVKSETDRMTNLRPLQLQRNMAGEIILTYQFTEGEKQTYHSVPHFVLIVNKGERGAIKLTETN